MALTLEEIWRTRNMVLHQNCAIDLTAFIHCIQSKFKELSLFLSTPIHSQAPMTLHYHWQHLGFTPLLLFFFFFFVVSIFFAWIRRSSNEVAHKAARFTINSNMYFVFNKDNLSPALSAACKDDYSPCSSFF